MDGSSEIPILHCVNNDPYGKNEYVLDAQQEKLPPKSLLRTYNSIRYLALSHTTHTKKKE
jgi:hypothetical protein